MPSDLEKQQNEVLKEIAGGLDEALTSIFGDRISFTLVLFGDEKIANYISNCKREDAQEALKKLLERWEAETTDVTLDKLN